MRVPAQKQKTSRFDNVAYNMATMPGTTYGEFSIACEKLRSVSLPKDRILVLEEILAKAKDVLKERELDPSLKDQATQNLAE